MKKLRIIVGGYIGLYPTGGATWDYLQFPLGFKQLGHDVYYIEDTLHYPIFQKSKKAWNDASDCVSYLSNVMEKFDMKNKWAYRDVASGKTFGMSEQKLLEVCSTADVFVNISCSTFMRDEYNKIPARILIDSDPMFTQIQYARELIAEKKEEVGNLKYIIDNHNYLFTFGENINDEGCSIPRLDYKWLTTRQPICLDYWKNDFSNNQLNFTSVMNWSERKKLLFENEEWGQKDIEFLNFIKIPSMVPDSKFDVVMNTRMNPESESDMANIKREGWKLLSPDMVADSDLYRQFIFSSAAEFSVAKETYVKSNSGWFSCRSACYLAAGKPVITEETRWSKYIPAGEGLFSFTDISSAISAITEVKNNYKHHSKKAIEIATEYFDSNKVLNNLLNQLK